MSKHVMIPWSDLNEFNTVFNSIYQNNNSIDFDYDLLLFAKNKLTIWLTRMQHNIEISVNLMATKEIISALIEDNNNKRNEEFVDESVVYSLFALSVVRFCTAISQYSNENNMKSVKRLAHRYSCPQWIIDCRHNLCHSSANQPSLEELRTATMIGLKWLRQYFWSKIFDKLHFESNSNRNYFELIDGFVSSDNSKTKKKAKNEIIFCLKYFRNELISALIQHLVNTNGSTNSEKTVNNESLRVPKLHLRKFSQIFAIINDFNSLSIVLNLIVSYFDNENQSKQYSAISWFSTLIKCIQSVTKISKFKRSFQNLTLNRVMSRIDWIRLLYRIVKRPNRFTPVLIQLIAPIVADVISDEKIQSLIKLSNIYVSNTPIEVEVNLDESNVSKEFKPKSVEDFVLSTDQINASEREINDSIDWSQINFGASVGMPGMATNLDFPINSNELFSN